MSSSLYDCMNMAGTQKLCNQNPKNVFDPKSTLHPAGLRNEFFDNFVNETKTL